MQKPLPRIVTPAAAITGGLLLSALLIMAAGRNPLAMYAKMVSMTFGSTYGTGQVIFRTTTLVLAGLAVAIPFRAKLFNIGGEGQILAGAFTAAVTAAFLPSWTPAPAAIAIAALAGAAAGSAMGLSAGLLKVRYGVNEVISTIMLNFIIQGFTSYMLTNHLALPSTAHTPDIIDATIIPALWQHSPANYSVLLAGGTTLAGYFLLFRTRFGFEMRACGLNAEAAAHAGIDTGMHTLYAMAAGGAAAGLVAANLVLGYRHCFEAGLTAGIGFTGIAVALLAKAHPLWILPSALLFGFMEYGGLSVNAYVPKEIFMMMQAVIIIMVLVMQKK
ncbi:ABC transporter permease [Prosthecochloris sp. CIB 2401]|uniref:ABC transporter permease n=1 Tax=Prosthecochloris sp. CIB 2401 TaxID=1868325 RepID=UPI00080AA750|nr:ABC transporter permease [Prosthecochloris sp. CIB 2401]ANT64987.1 ABC-type uncharacterized transport system, permease component [Prosthecochloris sp. CIB 2401]